MYLHTQHSCIKKFQETTRSDQINTFPFTLLPSSLRCNSPCQNYGFYLKLSKWITKFKVPEFQLESVYLYSRCKAKAQHRNLRSSLNGSQNKSLKSKLNGRVSKSESLILAKALFLHLKKSIIVTGLLRLLNTAIQAFPALLVARLLRLIEAGDTAHPSRAIRAALDLVAVLSVKMVVENQYFHSIVKCSTMVRGSLSGMIFDKSLKVAADAGYETADDVNEKSDGGDEKETKKSNDATSSSVLNLVQSDVAIIENAALQIHTVWGKSTWQ